MTTFRRIPRLIYVTDRQSASRSVPEIAAAAVKGGADLVQIREKDLAPEALLELATSVLNAVGDPSKVAVNGSPEVAAALGIGLHLPETCPIPDDQGRAGVQLLSRSVHSPAGAASSGSCDFLIAGHVYDTRSKPGRSPLGTDGLAAIVAASPLPVVAIGGITPVNVAAVVGAGAAGVAVLSGINAAADPKAAARAYRRALEDVMSNDQTMDVVINGKPATIPHGITVIDYLKSRGFHDRLVVVELNGQILAKTAFAETALSPGDRVEIVHFVGGG